MSKNKKYYEFKLAHGWFGGHIKETDVICTIDSGISMWHTLIIEKYEETNEITQRERESTYQNKQSDGLHHGL